MPPKASAGGNGSRLTPRGGGGTPPQRNPAPPQPAAWRGRGNVAPNHGVRNARGGQRGATVVEVVDSDNDVAPVSAQVPIVDDAGLGDDLAEAISLGVDPDFIEQIRLMSPRSRATILTDLRGSMGVQTRAQPQYAPPPMPAPDFQPRGRSRRGDPGRAWHWEPPQPHHHHEEEDEWEDDSDGENDYDFYAPPPPSRGQFQHPHHAMQNALLHAMLGGGRINVQGRRQMQEMLAQAQAAAQQAQALGAGLDVDNMSYEELLALESRMGHVSMGLQKAQIDQATEIVAAPSTPSPSKSADADNESCVICMTEFSATPDNDCRRIRLCGHVFHDPCLTRWLNDNRRCPICNRDIV